MTVITISKAHIFSYIESSWVFLCKAKNWIFSEDTGFFHSGSCWDILTTDDRHKSATYIQLERIVSRGRNHAEVWVQFFMEVMNLDRFMKVKTSVLKNCWVLICEMFTAKTQIYNRLGILIFFPPWTLLALGRFPPRRNRMQFLLELLMEKVYMHIYWAE